MRKPIDQQWRDDVARAGQCLRSAAIGAVVALAGSLLSLLCLLAGR